MQALRIMGRPGFEPEDKRVKSLFSGGFINPESYVLKNVLRTKTE